MTTTIYICVCGDDGTGKSSLIASLVKGTGQTNRIQPVLPKITVPPAPNPGGENISTVIVDTSSSPQERGKLNYWVKESNVILLVYSDNYSYERISLFWMPHFRSLGVNVPVVLCANKSDLAEASMAKIAEDEMMPVMAEFKEIESCVRASARKHNNVNETFYLCQEAVTDPIAPIFDSKESELKPAATKALQRIFHFCDRDRDGHLNDKELQNFQLKCFGSRLNDQDVADLREAISSWDLEFYPAEGLTCNGFLLLCRLYAEQGRHKTVWIIMRAFHYTASLSLSSAYASPKFEVPINASAELSPAGYQFFLNLFLVHDKDNDGGLNDAELESLFTPTPGLPQLWVDTSFPNSAVRNQAGYTTLQGWLALWSMTTYMEPKTTLAYLAYLGYEPASKPGVYSADTTTALKVTKPRKKRRRTGGRVERNVVHAYILGSSGCGKSALLDSFLNRSFSHIYTPTIKPRTAVNSVELHGGKQIYLILSELGELEPAILENASKLSSADLILYAYDSSDADSFSHITTLRSTYPHLDNLPSLYLALKADKDKSTQHSEVQPEEYTAQLSMPKPTHVSVAWGSVGEAFVAVAETALNPALGFPKRDGKDEEKGNTTVWLGLATAAAVGAAGMTVWRRGGI